MNFKEFNSLMKIIDGIKAQEMRDNYIENFVNINSDIYKDNILKKKKYSDGLYYSGYLWETLLSATVINEKLLLDKMGQIKNELFLLWDLHSKEKIEIANYWRFPRDAILLGFAKDIISGLEYLPEDIYIFNNKFEWSYILTHESTIGDVRLCYLATSRKPVNKYGRGVL
jgi:hypothetical protein